MIKKIITRFQEKSKINLENEILKYSNRELIEIKKSVLNKGIKLKIKETNIDPFEIISRFELLAQHIRYTVF